MTLEIEIIVNQPDIRDLTFCIVSLVIIKLTEHWKKTNRPSTSLSPYWFSINSRNMVLDLFNKRFVLKAEYYTQTRIYQQAFYEMSNGKVKQF